jgi:hypothetical protein
MVRIDQPPKRNCRQKGKRSKTLGSLQKKTILQRVRTNINTEVIRKTVAEKSSNNGGKKNGRQNDKNKKR